MLKYIIYIVVGTWTTIWIRLGVEIFYLRKVYKFLDNNKTLYIGADDIIHILEMLDNTDDVYKPWKPIPIIAVWHKLKKINHEIKTKEN